MSEFTKLFPSIATIIFLYKRYQNNSSFSLRDQTLKTKFKNAAHKSKYSTEFYVYLLS